MSQQYYKGSDGNFYPVRQNTSAPFKQYNNNPLPNPQFVPTYQGNGNGSQPALIYKRSGAVYSKIKEGNFVDDTIVNAWRSTKLGLMKAVVTPYRGESGKGLEIVHSNGKSGNTPKEYQKMICKITNDSVGTSQIYPVLMNLKTKVIVIQELSLCITPNGQGTTKKGKRVTGYFGKNYTSNGRN